jgi:hypothetical protein
MFHLQRLQAELRYYRHRPRPQVTLYPRTLFATRKTRSSTDGKNIQRQVETALQHRCGARKVEDVKLVSPRNSFRGQPDWNRMCTRRD